MPDPIASRVDDPYRSWQSNDEDDSTCKEGSLVSWADTPRGEPPPSPAKPGVVGPHAEAHVEDGDLYAGAFVLQGRDPSGVMVEVFSASFHHGETERGVQAGMARIGGSSDDLHWIARGEAFTAQAHSGFENADGSTGFGVSMGATVVGAEATGTIGPLSLTGGASIGSTVGASIGVRDGDSDGKSELCGRLEFGVGTAGLCVEKWW